MDKILLMILNLPKNRNKKNNNNNNKNVINNNDSNNGYNGNIYKKYMKYCNHFE